MCTMRRSMITLRKNMENLRIHEILLCVVCIELSVFAATDSSRFKSYPSIATLPIGVRITFEVAQPTDVEMSVLDAKDKVVRHLAAGVLGGELAPPEPLQKSMRQSIQWDGRDDSGQTAIGGPFTVRLRMGLQSRLGGVIGSAGALSGKVYGLATDENGNLYVGSGAVYSSAPVFSIKVFDSSGKYLRTILPMPAHLTAKQAAEFGAGQTIDGHLKPRNYNALVPYVQDGGIVAFTA